MRLQNLTIRAKLFLGFGLLLLLTMLLGLFGYSGLQSIQKMAKVTDEITQAEANLLYARLSTRSYMMLHTDNWANDAKDALQKITVNTDNLIAIINDSEKSQAFLKLKTSAQQYRAGLDEVIGAIKSQNTLQANMRAINDKVMASGASRNGGAALTLFLQARVYEGEFARFLHPEDKEIWFSLVAKSVAAAQQSKSSITPLLLEYQAEAQKLAEAAVKQKEAETKQVEYGTLAKQIIGDESIAVKAETQQMVVTTASAILIIFLISLIFGIVVSGFVVKQIMTAIRQSVAVVEQVAQGDLTVKIDATLLNRDDEMGKLLKSLNNMVAKLRDIAQSITVGAENIAAAGAEMSSNSQSMSEGSTEQASAAEEVSSSMEQMAANIQQNTDNAQQAEKIATMGVESLRKSNVAVTQAIAGMKTIAEKITIISDIAFQTNILALNAAVEAARAGEHGRGFAVVAAEVRKLAERSKFAADEINALSKNGVASSDEAGLMLSELMPQIEKTAKLVMEISAASLEQNSGAMQINNAIQQLNQVTQQNAAASEEMATTSEELASQADQLKDTVAFFRTEELSHRGNVVSKKAPVHNTHKAYTAPPKPAVKVAPKSSKGFNLGLTNSKDSEYEHF